ncbi:MAG: hypothetical protein M1160_02985 [Candidatus Marsarchaeota archaeon]|jgi:hypothetical protein|nr:hypothetical protein [Candidatus Marsarchaeota archaeon]MCL5111818.1 hypothetical protein [Candidatus Marsarchaeota archaeon]
MNRIALIAVVVIIVIIAALLLGFPLGFYSTWASGIPPAANTCIAKPGYFCGGVVLHNGNLTFTVGQDTGTNWKQANIFVVIYGQTPRAVPPLPCEDGFLHGIASGQHVNVALASYSNSNTCAGFNKTIGWPLAGAVWAGYRTSINGTESIVEIGTIALKAS